MYRKTAFILNICCNNASLHCYFWSYWPQHFER